MHSYHVILRKTILLRPLKSIGLEGFNSAQSCPYMSEAHHLNMMHLKANLYIAFW